MKTAGSNFATRAGLAVLLILVLACAYFGLAAPGVSEGGEQMGCCLYVGPDDVGRVGNCSLVKVGEGFVALVGLCRWGESVVRWN